MKKILVLLFFHLSIIALAQEAKDIVKNAEEKSKGKTSIANITIQTIRPTWTREMTVKAWTKGNDLSFILVLAPAKEKGVVFLKRKKEVWNWIPSIERTIKMPPSMMSQSWMGTDFTNDDLVKEASILEDYNHSFLEDVIVDGRSCYKIQLLPKPKSAVVWGKVIMDIDKKDFMMLYVEYYDEDGMLINTMHCSDIKLLGDRLLPGKMEMIPANKKGNKTVLIYNSLVFDTPLDDSFFTTQNITKAK
ncbi:outer membrane lipoprotein-sorting protein [Flavobacterium praedii]|uniref:outer membrane lipoprotein-sorting protein n=1 Tax=Flavobacterium praedii TaxID=3002900 RepID=UPI0024820BAD|nr:outer membrane lipoprotein-sorting protein [Flavobacterium praedii]